jgi:hypothetical protein
MIQGLNGIDYRAFWNRLSRDGVLSPLFLTFWISNEKRSFLGWIRLAALPPIWSKFETGSAAAVRKKLENI